MVKENILSIVNALPGHVKLVAVSKTHPPEAIMDAYHTGQRIFGENRVQELISKQPVLPADIEWHLIGHLQTNKVRVIAPFISMIHSVDSLKLLVEINKEALKNNRTIDCLLQIYIATEDTKFGMDEPELMTLLNHKDFANLKNIRICGLMGIATYTEDSNRVRDEFRRLTKLFRLLRETHFSNDPFFKEISMGMTHDYQIAIEEGSTMVRIGTAIFGERS